MSEISVARKRVQCKNRALYEARKSKMPGSIIKKLQRETVAAMSALDKVRNRNRR